MLSRGDRPAFSRGAAHVYPAGISSLPFTWLIKFYQQHVSPIDGDRCPMYPTCSQYGLQAIHEHGAVMGIIMTADRLMHELGEQEFTPLKRIGNRYRYLDPIENNDFWWHRQ